MECFVYIYICKVLSTQPETENPQPKKVCLEVPRKGWYRINEFAISACVSVCKLLLLSCCQQCVRSYARVSIAVTATATSVRCGGYKPAAARILTLYDDVHVGFGHSTVRHRHLALVAAGVLLTDVVQQQRILVEARIGRQNAVLAAPVELVSGKGKKDRRNTSTGLANATSSGQKRQNDVETATLLSGNYQL